MAEIILHHYATSMFSERVRLALGLKGLAWRSVTIPGMMPKPDLLPLTGGYRKTPVLQIGADVYCDTLLILRKLEDLHPEPSLYPDGSQALAMALGWWADKSLLPHALGILAATIGDTLPPDFVAERRAFGFQLDRAEANANLQRHQQQAAAHLDWLISMLADGRPFLLGDHPGAADLAVSTSLWLLKVHVGPAAEARLPMASLDGWYGRVCALGHGEPRDMTAAEALDAAAAAEPEAVQAADADPSGIAIGTDVIIAADDTGRDPVRGRLLSTDAQEAVVATEHPRVGRINLHIPRAGFDVVRA